MSGGCTKPQFDYHGFKLTRMQIEIIEAFRKNPGIRQREVAKLVGCGPGHVSRTMILWRSGDMMPLSKPEIIRMRSASKTRRKRTCLRCGRMFVSEHSGHRLCGCPMEDDGFGILPEEEYHIGHI